MVRFKAFYLPDHIFPLTLNHRQKMPDYATCVSCRLCDTACPQVALNPDFPAPSYMVTGFSRSLTDHHLARNYKIRCADCRVCEAICPQQVPIGAIMDFVSHNAGLPKASP